MARSAKGKEVNMAALRFKNQNATTVGNVRMNAKGDLLGKNGKIIKTREQLAQEYNTKVANAAVNVPLSQSPKKMAEAANRSKHGSTVIPPVPPQDSVKKIKTPKE